MSRTCAVCCLLFQFHCTPSQLSPVCELLNTRAWIHRENKYSEVAQGEVLVSKRNTVSLWRGKWDFFKFRSRWEILLGSKTTFGVEDDKKAPKLRRHKIKRNVKIRWSFGRHSQNAVDSSWLLQSRSTHKVLRSRVSFLSVSLGAKLSPSISKTPKINVSFPLSIRNDHMISAALFAVCRSFVFRPWSCVCELLEIVNTFLPSFRHSISQNFPLLPFHWEFVCLPFQSVPPIPGETPQNTLRKHTLSQSHFRNNKVQGCCGHNIVKACHKKRRKKKKRLYGPLCLVRISVDAWRTPEDVLFQSRAGDFSEKLGILFGQLTQDLLSAHNSLEDTFELLLELKVAAERNCALKLHFWKVLKPGAPSSMPFLVSNFQAAFFIPVALRENNSLKG